MMKLIHEYAIDPEIIKDWRSLRDLSDKMGVSKGRVIARMPKTWFRDIYDRFATSTVADARLEFALRRLGRAILPTGRTAQLHNQTWLEVALKEHRQRPFRAIITTANSENRDLVNPEDLSEDHSKWKAPRELPIPRNSDEWVKAAELLLSACSELILIDPHFKPDAARYQRSLKALCLAATRNNPRRPKIEYHVGKSESITEQEFETKCRSELPDLISEGVKIEFVIWSCRIGGQDFHARYVLTNHGGIRIDHGLDERRSATTDTDVSLLDDDMFQRRKTDFTHNHPDCAFNKLHLFEIVGRRRVA